MITIIMIIIIILIIIIAINVIVIINSAVFMIIYGLSGEETGVVIIAADQDHYNVLALQWRHNKRDGVSNHLRPECLLNRLFRHRSKKTSKLRVTGLCEGNSPLTGEFPAHKGPVTWKMFPFDDVIIFTVRNFLNQHKTTTDIRQNMICTSILILCRRFMPTCFSGSYSLHILLNPTTSTWCDSIAIILRGGGIKIHIHSLICPWKMCAFSKSVLCLGIKCTSSQNSISD